MKNFGLTPSVRFNRSKFDLSHGVKTTMSVGKLYPLDCVEVLPGDSFKNVMTAVCRTTSPFFKPICDNLFMDVHHFFVPYRLLYDESEKVFGNPNPSQYTTDGLADYPTLPKGMEVISGTVGDYLGLPVSENVQGKKFLRKGVSIMPFRAFAKIYNDWFRNENSTDEIYVQKGSLQSSEYLNNNAWSPNNYTGKLPNVGKKKDYFTSCLPGTQKGEPVLLPLGNYAPVITNNTALVRDYPQPPMFFLRGSDGSKVSGSKNAIFGDISGESANRLMADLSASESIVNADSVVPANLVADLSNATAADIATLRNAFQLQKVLEADSRFGSRYNEFLLGHFGVVSPDARLQFSEYLGGGRIPISVQQVSQTAPLTEYTDSDSEVVQTAPLGSLGAFSQSLGRSRYTKGFVEHGYVMTVGCIKQLHTYQQGVPRHFFRHKREDFYDPKLANISEQPVYKSQLFGYDSETTSGIADGKELTDGVFAYNEAWAEYRYLPSIVTGQMRSGLSNSLDIWHLADYFSSEPTYGQGFTEENNDNIDRVLTVETSSQDNFLVDIWFHLPAVRVMPVYSVPGLVDHH